MRLSAPVFRQRVQDEVVVVFGRQAGHADRADQRPSHPQRHCAARQGDISSAVAVLGEIVAPHRALLALKRPR